MKSKVDTGGSNHMKSKVDTGGALLRRGRRRVAFAAAGVMLVAAVADGAAAGASAPREGAAPAAVVDPGARLVPGEVLIRFREGLPAAARSSALQAHGVAHVRDLALPDVVLGRLAQGKDVLAAADALSKRADVLYAEPNWIYRAAATPNDPRFSQLWGMHQASDVDIDAPEAWNVTTGSSDVVVAVADSGVAYTHPDLAPNMWTNTDETAGNGVDDDGNGRIDDVRGWDFVDSDNDPFDWGDGHGTHVAGTIGAKGNNATGVVGVNWNVKLMPLRVLGPEGGTNEGIAQAFAYAAAKGAKVVNASLGGPGFSQTMKDAIDAASGTLFVVAAGNGGGDGIGDNNDTAPAGFYPCNYTSANLICVAATTATDNITTFSNYGTTSVDLGAPGNAIVSTYLGFESGFDVLFADGFETARGWTAGGTPNTWARTNEGAASGSWSATDSPGGNYVNDTANWYQMPGSVNLSGRSSCAVRYALRLNTDFPSSIDPLEVDGSTGDGTWQGISYEYETTPGYPNSWPTSEWPLYDFVDASAFRVRFRFTSDSGGVANGAHVDNVEVGCAGMAYNADSYESLPGTSMASPHVAGVAALAWAKNPSVSVAQVRTAILDGGNSIASLSGKTVTGRRLNAAGTLAMIPAGSSPPDTVVAGPSGTYGRSSASFALSSVPGGASFECRVNGGAWAACSSPYVVTTIVPGHYAYEFRAVNGSGADASPAVATLRVVRPFVADWDGNGKANIAVWRPAVGAWYVNGAATNWFGLNGDVPAPGQWDADAELDRAIWRPEVGGWYVEGSATVYHGAREDVPVPADWDGNGVLDHIVWRPAHGGWYVRGVGTFYFGARGDVPVLGDYDADPQLDLAVYRNGAWYIEGSATVFHGLAGDVPVPADWNGDGKTDIAVYRPSNSTWYIRNISTTPFGLPGDVPIVGDFDADAAVDRAIWRPDSGGWYVEGSLPVFFGLATDIP